MKCGSVVDELFRIGTCSVKSSGNDFRLEYVGNLSAIDNNITLSRPLRHLKLVAEYK